MLLTSINDLVSVVTASAVALDVHASYVDLSGTTVTPARTNTLQITTAITTTVVPSPGASTQRKVKFLTIRNTHATSSNDITVRHTDGTTVVTMIKFVLLAGYSLIWDGVGWVLYDTFGARVDQPAPGRWLRTTVLTTASANHTVGADTKTIRIRGVGGGGAGGGCTSLAAAAVGAGGGGGGSYLEKTVAVTPSTAYAYTCGAAGVGASGGAGGNGGNSTFVVGATTYTAPGGTGAPVGTAATTLVTRGGGAGGVVSTNGDVNSAGQPGGYGVCLIVATPIVASGNGGSGPFGAGGLGLVAVGAGNIGVGFGSGGGGSATGASTVRTGGNGTAGVWVVDEFS